MHSQLAFLALSFAQPAVPVDTRGEPTYEPLSYSAFTNAPPIAMESEHGGSTYFRFSGGLVTTESSDGPSEDIDFNEGYLLAVAFGQRITSSDSPLNFDLELEAVWTDQDAEDSGPIQALDDLAVLGVLVNGTLYFNLGERLALYGGAGIGAAWLNAGTTTNGINDFDAEDGPFLAWQVRAGVQWALGSGTALNVGYRFLNIDDAQIDDDVGAASFDLETQQHVLEIGLRFGL